MAVNAYITLAENSGSNAKRFRVLMGSYKPAYTKTNSSKRTITGKLDVQLGSVVQTWAMTLKVKAVETDSNYGTLAELLAFYQRNAASGASNVKLKFTEFNDANTHTVVMAGEVSVEMLTPVLDGANALFYVPVALEKAD